MNKLSIVLDVWDIDSQDPRGIVSFKRHYAKACANLAKVGLLKVGFAGTGKEQTWLSKQGLLDNCSFHTFRIPGRFQRTAADVNLPGIGYLINQPDIYHIFGNFPFLSGRTRVVGTLVDFVPLRVPEFVPVNFTLEQVRWCMWAAEKGNAKWIAISEQTKQDAMALARVEAGQVAVVDIGVEDDMYLPPDYDAISETLRACNIRPPYLLCVNTFNPRKNHERLINAWEQGGFAALGWTLVLAGHPAGNPLIERLQTNTYQGVKWVGYASRKDLVNLYHGCEGFVYPSLYEGFGIPVAEAVVAGKAILTSHRSPMAKIAGGAALCVDPWSVQSLLNGLHQLISSDTLRSHLSEYSKSQRAKFSMEKVAENLLMAYYSLR